MHVIYNFTNIILQIAESVLDIARARVWAVRSNTPDAKQKIPLGKVLIVRGSWHSCPPHSPNHWKSRVLLCSYRPSLYSQTHRQVSFGITWPDTDVNNKMSKE